MPPETTDSSCRDPENGALPDMESPPFSAVNFTAIAKTLRLEADKVLQRLKQHRKELADDVSLNTPHDLEDRPEALAQLTLAQRDLESSIMRLGMVLKNIGATPNPYPQSYNPASSVIEETADGVQL